MVPGGLEPFLFGQVSAADRRDDGPVVPDPSALQTSNSKVDSLELHSGNPKSREQMPLSAADHDIATDVIAEAAG